MKIIILLLVAAVTAAMAQEFSMDELIARLQESQLAIETLELRLQELHYFERVGEFYQQFDFLTDVPDWQELPCPDGSQSS